MLVTCWSVKGGSGTTVVAAALALLLARRCAGGALLVDAGGDLPAALGLPDPPGPGLAEWAAAADLPSSALGRLCVDAGGGLRLLPRGAGDIAAASASRVLDALAAPPAPGDGAAPGSGGGLPAGGDGPAAAVVVDAGPPSALSLELAARATLSLLVLRPCYLALRRAAAAPVRPSAVVLVDEPHRSLDAADVEDVLGSPVRAVVPFDAAIARCVDAGLLATRLPRPLAAALRRAA